MLYPRVPSQAASIALAGLLLCAPNAQAQRGLSAAKPQAPVPTPSTRFELPPPAPDPQLVPMHHAEQHLNIPVHQRVSMEVPELPRTQFKIEVPVDGSLLTLDLGIHSVRSADYQAYDAQPGGELLAVPAARTRTFRGTVRGDRGSWVAGSLLSSGAELLIEMSDGQRFEVQPHFESFLSGKRDQYIVFRPETALFEGGSCDVDGMTPVPQEIGPQSLGTSGCGGDYCVAEVALDLDHPYYVLYGSSTILSRNMAELTVNVANLQYERQLEITHRISAVITRTSAASEPASYQNTTTRTELYENFRAHWNANHTSIVRDTAHLFNDRYTGGRARIGAICNTSVAYGVDFGGEGTIQCRSNIFAHELGHNWNSDHCSCSSSGFDYTMHATYPPCALHFNPTLTVPVIEAYRDSRTCLDGGVENDDCLSAYEIGNGSVFGSTLHATLDADSTCVTGFEDGPDVWYVYSTGSFGGTLTADTCGPGTQTPFDTIVSIWEGCPGTTGATEIGCNDQFCGNQSSVSVSVADKTSYWIRVAGWNGSRGDFELSVSGPGISQPINDGWEDAIIIGPGEYRGNTAAATRDGSATCDNAGTAADVWYRFDPGTSGVLAIDGCQSDYDVAISLHDRAHPQPWSSAAVVACDANACGLKSSLAYVVDGSKSYLIRVSGWGDSEGSYVLKVSGRESDANLSTLPIEAGSIVMDLQGAGTPTGDATCSSQTEFLPDFKFRVTAPFHGTMRVKTCGTHDYRGTDAGMEPVLSVHTYQGSSVPPTTSNQLGCSISNTGTCFNADQGNQYDGDLTLPVTTGTQYVIRMGRYTTATPAGIAFLDVRFTPANDLCQLAYDVTDGSYGGHVTGAFNDGSSTCSETSVSPDVWFKYTPPANGELRVTTCGTYDLIGPDAGLDTMVSLHSGCPGTSSNQIACSSGASFGLCNDSHDAYNSVSVSAFQPVYIRVVGEAPNAEGQFVLNVNFIHSNDTCETAQPIGNGTLFGELVDAGRTPSLPPELSPDLWYSYTAPCSGVMKVSTCGSHDLGGIDQGLDTFLAVHSACPATTQNQLAFGTNELEACGTLDQGAKADAYIEMFVTAGTTYLIRVGAFGSIIDGTFRLNIACDEGPAVGCTGAGTSSLCPCGNPGGADRGCANSVSNGSKLTGVGSGSLSANSLDLTHVGMRPNEFGILFSGLTANAVTFGDGLRCISGTTRRSQAFQSSAQGTNLLTGVFGNWNQSAGASDIGSQRHIQAWYRDPGGPCGSGFNLSNSLIITVIP